LDFCNSIAFGGDIETTLKDKKKVAQIGKQKILELSKKLNLAKEFLIECKNEISETGAIYESFSEDGTPKPVNSSKFTFKEAVIKCLKHMRQKSTRPIKYNDLEERDILSLEIKYTGF
jgi:hypothetical protein